MKFKMDIKSALILILFVGLIFVGYKWWLVMDNKELYKHQINELKVKNEILVEKRDSINGLIIDLNEEISNYIMSDSILNEEIDILKANIRRAKVKAAASEKKLKKIRLKLKDTADKIKQLEEAPPIKEDDDLLNSLKNKIQK